MTSAPKNLCANLQVECIIYFGLFWTVQNQRRFPLCFAPTPVVGTSQTYRESSARLLGQILRYMITAEIPDCCGYSHAHSSRSSQGIKLCASNFNQKYFPRMWVSWEAQYTEGSAMMTRHRVHEFSLIWYVRICFKLVYL